MCSHELGASKTHFHYKSKKVKNYQAPPRCLVYVQEEPFKKEVEWLQ